MFGLGSTTTRRRRAGLRAGVALPAALLCVAGLLSGTSSVTAQADTTTSGDGTTQSTAGASCWGIKQAYPASADGTYWLQTATLGTPQQFYCDMTTDGGGWVLVGRGRENWTFRTTGQGSASALYTNPTGTAAFAPAALDTDTINGLLDGGRVDALSDGIRIRRAADSAGSTWQELRWHVASEGSWSWAFGGGIILSSASVNGTSYAGSNTADSYTNYDGQTTNGLKNVNTASRWFTYPLSGHNSEAGFSYGKTVSGSNTSTSYLWQYGSEGYPIGFSQVWLRPMIANSTYTAIGDSGLPASTVPWALNNKPDDLQWGVSGVAPATEKVEPDGSEIVLSLHQLGSSMFVGGRFATVQNGSGGATTAQPYLAAFDVTSGAWIPTFRPTLNGRVWDMVTTPSGKLLIAGDFTTVNGKAAAGIALLNPTTGALDATFSGSMSRTNSTAPAMVRALAINGNNVYAGGNFNGYTGGGASTAASVSRLVEFNAVTGKRVATWKPAVHGLVDDMALSSDNSRVYLVGYFADTNGDTSKGYASQVDATTGANVAGLSSWVPSTTGSKYQQAVLEYDGHVYEGGSEHDLQMYDPSTFALQYSHTYKSGGDIQAITVVNGHVFAACHCQNWDYSGSNTYSPPSNYTSVNPVNFIGEYTAGTLAQETGFLPTVDTVKNGEGAWALTGDSNNCLWFGGDFDARGYTGTASDWLGGFGRVCPVDQQAPTAPTSLTASAWRSGAQTLSWSAASDDVGVTRYQILRDDRVIGTTASLSFVAPAVTGTSRYWVRAVDAAGNVSATSNLVTVTAAAS